MAEPIDLGRITLCLNAADVDETATFYERLGFRATGVDAPGLRRTLIQGRTVLTFMSFLRRPLVNFRGASIHALVTKLAKRGFQIVDHNLPDPELQLMLDDDGEPLPDNECGYFTVTDPDGNEVFFNTHPPERAPYIAASWLTDPALVADVSIPLGKLVLCLGVKDLATSVRFYQELGFDLLDRGADTATLGALPPHVDEDPNGFPLELRQAVTADATLAFRCGDSEGVVATLRELGVELETTPDGSAFVDPDGRRIALTSAPPSS